mgnify:CR=1 FL=1
MGFIRMGTYQVLARLESTLRSLFESCPAHLGQHAAHSLSGLAQTSAKLREFMLKSCFLTCFFASPSTHSDSGKTCSAQVVRRFGLSTATCRPSRNASSSALSVSG